MTGSETANADFATSVQRQNLSKPTPQDPATLVPPVLVLLAILILGLLKFADPLGGDQSLFLIGAHAIRNGATLYQTFWDLKQPGIYVFYFLATAFGSYSPVAVHFFELLYMLTFAYVQMITLHATKTFRAVATIAPITTIGFYFISVGSFEQIQVESLVGFPLYVATWCTYAGSQTKCKRTALGFYLAAGLASATVLIFKLIFLPILAVVIAIVLFRRRQDLLTYLKAISAIAFGTTIPILGMVFYFTSHHALGKAVETWFALPPQIVSHIPHESSTMFWNSARWFAHRYVGMIFLAMIGIYSALRLRPETLTFGLLAWIVCGITVILIQTTSWFQYQWILVATPLGLFAALGIHTLWEAIRTAPRSPKRLIGTAALLCTFIFPISLFLKDIQRLATHGFALTEIHRIEYRDAESAVYAACRRDATYLPDNRRSVYVIGDPTFYITAHRLQSIALNGSSVRLFLPDQWSQLYRELIASPPSALYISHQVIIASKDVNGLISHKYKLRHRGTNGDLLFLI